MRNFIVLSVLIVQIRCQNVGIPCSQENGIFCVLPENGATGFQDVRGLPRRNPGQVGDIVSEMVEEGRTQTMITKATNPPIFELPDFLTDSECDHIKELALKKGMIESTLFGEKALVSQKRMRKTKTTFVSAAGDPVLKRIQNRAIALTNLPQEIVYNSEEFQIGHYHVGGFYKFHYDSHPVSRDILMERPCCQHIERPHSGNKCTICRYVTILMYLNDVDEGGETAFPLADQSNALYTRKLSNMSYSCVNAPVIVSPQKGKAVMWYNNVIDPEHGWLGVHDINSLHGGCPITKGDKWISNLWINAPQYHSVNKKTIFHDEF